MIVEVETLADAGIENADCSYCHHRLQRLSRVKVLTGWLAALCGRCGLWSHIRRTDLEAA
jgi:transcription elongation factor Elf1